jgi:hypothetical protein
MNCSPSNKKGRNIHSPDEQTVQVGIRPFLALPPMIEFPLFLGFHHGVGRRLLGNDP